MTPVISVDKTGDDAAHLELDLGCFGTINAPLRIGQRGGKGIFVDVTGVVGTSRKHPGGAAQYPGQSFRLGGWRDWL